MKIITSPSQMQAQTEAWRAAGFTIGLVPTMGYLHEGHLSLAAAARESCDIVVMSIFVNPTQFAPNEDLATYPRSLAHDAQLAHGAGVDCLFCPSAAQMYPPGYASYMEVEGLSQRLCGITRPSHFRGVATVCLKLFHIVLPHHAFFGQKDAQQYLILRRMVEDMNLPLQLHRCPIVREADGLAKSSRNLYLDAQQRQNAVALHQALTHAQALYEAGVRDAATLRAAVVERIEATPGAKLDYVEFVSTVDLQPLEHLEKPFLMAMAVYFGKTRLIDNWICE